MLSTCTAEINEDPYPSFQFPLLKDAEDVKIYWDNDIFGKDTRYRIPSAISPETIFNFYRNEFSKIGFTANSKAVYTRLTNPENNYIKEGNWLDPPARYTMGWINSEGTMVIKVTISYSTNGEINVICFIHPFSDYTKLNELIKELEQQGKIKEFYRILGQYKKENGNFDLEEAIKKEPPSDLIDAIAKFFIEDYEQLKNSYLKFISAAGGSNITKTFRLHSARGMAIIKKDKKRRKSDDE